MSQKSELSPYLLKTDTSFDRAVPNPQVQKLYTMGCYKNRLLNFEGLMVQRLLNPCAYAWKEYDAKRDINTFQAEIEGAEITLDVKRGENWDIEATRFRKRFVNDTTRRESIQVAVRNWDGPLVANYIHTHHAPVSRPEYAWIANDPYDNTDLIFTRGLHLASYSSRGIAEFAVGDRDTDLEADYSGYSLHKSKNGELFFPEEMAPYKPLGDNSILKYRWASSRIRIIDGDLIVITSNPLLQWITRYRAPLDIDVDKWLDFLNSPEWYTLGEEYPLKGDQPYMKPSAYLISTDNTFALPAEEDNHSISSI